MVVISQAEFTQLTKGKSLGGIRRKIRAGIEYGLSLRDDNADEDAADSALLVEARAASSGGPRLGADAALAVADGSLHPLTAWREAAGLTQTALAERAGLRAATISEIETGKIDPRLSTLSALAKALGVEVGDLVPAAV